MLEGFARLVRQPVYQVEVDPFEIQFATKFLFHFCGQFVDDAPDGREFLRRDDLRHHDLRADRDGSTGTFGGRLEYGSYLHRVHFRIGNAEAHAAMTEHRVDLLQLADLLPHALFPDQRIIDQLLAQLVERLRQFAVPVQACKNRLAPADNIPIQAQVLDLLEQLLFGGQKLMHRRVEQPDGYRVR